MGMKPDGVRILLTLLYEKDVLKVNRKVNIATIAAIGYGCVNHLSSISEFGSLKQYSKTRRNTVETTAGAPPL